MYHYLFAYCDENLHDISLCADHLCYPFPRYGENHNAVLATKTVNLSRPRCERVSKPWPRWGTLRVPLSVATDMEKRLDGRRRRRKKKKKNETPWTPPAFCLDLGMFTRKRFHVWGCFEQTMPAHRGESDIQSWNTAYRWDPNVRKSTTKPWYLGGFDIRGWNLPI